MGRGPVVGTRRPGAGERFGRGVGREGGGMRVLGLGAGGGMRVDVGGLDGGGMLVLVGGVGVELVAGVGTVLLEGS